MNKSCIVRAHGAGLFSNINKVLVCLRLYENVYVDWSKAAENDPAFRFGGSFYGDCWHDLFYDSGSVQGLIGKGAKEEQGVDMIYQYPFWDITDKCAGILYQHPEWNWRVAYHVAWKRLQCVVEPIPVGQDTVGVLIRSDALGGEQVYGESQSLEQYEHAMRRSKAGGFFIVSSDEESIIWLQERFQSSLYFSNSIKRNKKRADAEQHLTVPQTKADAIDVMREVLALARCKALIHPISNMSTAALIINPQLESIYLK